MTAASPSPAPTPAEPPQAARLAALVETLLGMILAAWWWHVAPGGHAMQARLRRQGDAFVALLRMIAAQPPAIMPPAQPGGALRRAWRRALGQTSITDDEADTTEWVLVRVPCGAWPIAGQDAIIPYPAPRPPVPWPRNAAYVARKGTRKYGAMARAHGAAVSCPRPLGRGTPDQTAMAGIQALSGDCRAS